MNMDMKNYWKFEADLETGTARMSNDRWVLDVEPDKLRLLDSEGNFIAEVDFIALETRVEEQLAAMIRMEGLS